MRVDVDSLPAAGRAWEIKPSLQWAVEAATEALEAAPTALTGRLEVVPREGGGLTVALDLQAEVAVSCDRCGEPVALGIHVDQTLRYGPPTPRQGGELEEPDGGEVELEEADLEVGWLTDGAVDLGDAVREALALELPPRRACRDEAACDARTEALLAAASPASTGHPAFSVLSRLAE